MDLNEEELIDEDRKPMFVRGNLETKIIDDAQPTLDDLEEYK